MSDFPIIFSAPMISALLEGRKTMTRRLAWRYVGVAHKNDEDLLRKPTPWQRVKPGDWLWVRESVVMHGGVAELIGYMADGCKVTEYWERAAPSIHMPRWASRLTLVVTATKIERLCDISAEDAIAEGIAWDGEPLDGANRGIAVALFMDLWARLHGDTSVGENPQVVALSFSVHKTNIDAMEKAGAA